MRRCFVTLCAALLTVSVGGVVRMAHAADPTTADCLAASEAALKSGNDHKLRAERSQLLVCAAPSCPTDIRKECGGRIDELNAQIPTIIFQAKDATGKDLSAVKITVDGEVLAERLEGTSLSIDPGNHTFVFETASQPVVQEQLFVTEGEKDRHERIVFGAASAGPSAPVPAPLPSPPDLSAPSSSSALGTQRILAIVAGGVGVVGLGVGSAFGFIAMSKKNSAQLICPDVCADDNGVNAWKDAASAGNVSTALFIVGGVGLAGAAALWFTAPSSNGAPSSQVGFGPGSVYLKGTW